MPTALKVLKQLPVVCMQATNIDEYSHAAGKTVGAQGWETQGGTCTPLIPSVREQCRICLPPSQQLLHAYSTPCSLGQAGGNPSSSAFSSTSINASLKLPPYPSVQSWEKTQARTGPDA